MKTIEITLNVSVEADSEHEAGFIASQIQHWITSYPGVVNVGIESIEEVK